jgi:tripartite-type tricarboxylate transporter receptor subunit TctC
MPRLRDCILALFLTCLAATVGSAQEANSTQAYPTQAYPTHVVKIVVPSLPGSTTDIVARLVANELSEMWGKPVIVENMAGAAMAIGAEYVARAAPDGYTLLICPPSPVSIQQLLYHDLKYDPLKFTPIAMLAKIPNVLSVRPEFPANTIQELLAYGKANPGKLTYASQGAGSTAHLSGSELEVLGGIKMVHVPYNGAQPALRDVMAGNVDMFFDTLATSVPLYKDGKLKLLGVASEERSKDVPEIATIAEQGVPGFRSITWFPIVGPPGLPQTLADKINKDVDAVLQKPEIAGKLRTLRLEPMGGAPADAAAFFASETKLWGRVIKEANISLQ